MESTNYYEILGVSKDATQDEIKKAYRTQAFKYHPDRNAGNAEAEDMFKKINAAYSVLSDEAKRAEYDRYGSDYDSSSYRARQSAYDWASQSGEDYSDPFAQWARSEGSTRYNSSNGYHYYTWNPHFSGAKPSKSGSVLSILLYFLMTIMGLNLIWLFPIGLLMIIGGISGISRSFKSLFSRSSNTSSNSSTTWFFW